jgi:hypothetical protein
MKKIGVYPLEAKRVEPYLTVGKFPRTGIPEAFAPGGHAGRPVPERADIRLNAIEKAGP